MNQVKGIGFIGAGIIFEDHAKAWWSLRDRVRCIGIAEIDDGRRIEATRKHFLPVDVGDYHELLRRDDVDIVSICTPPAVHEEMIVAALEAGKYVICEKPLAPTLAAIDRIIALTSRFPNRLSTVYQVRYSLEMQKLNWLKNQGHLGRLISGRLSRESPLPRNATRAAGWWGRWSVAGGGVVMTQFIHHLDQLVCIFGKPCSVEAKMGTECQPIESEDWFSATVTFEQGAVVTCAGTANAKRFDWRMGVEGESIDVTLPWSLKCPSQTKLKKVTKELNKAFPNQSALHRKVLRRLKRYATGKLPHSAVNQHELQFVDVLDAIRTGGPLPVPPEEARKSVELCTAIYTAAITGDVVNLPIGSTSRFYEGVSVEDYRQACPVLA